MNSERRFCKAHGEVRATSQDGQKVLTGYALRYGKLSSTIKTTAGTFREKILPGACRSLAQSGFRGTLALWNHDPNYPLASVDSGTLKLTDDSRGLRYDIALGDTSYARDLHDNVMRGVVRGSSFGFSVDGGQGDDQWQERALTDDEEDDAEDDMDLFGVQQDDVTDDYDSGFQRKNEKRGKKILVRSIKNFRQITDVSPVTFAAYPSSSVQAAIRSATTVTLPANVLRKIMEQQEPQKKHDDARARRKNLLGVVLG